jgi:hypothetical protein
MLVCNLLVAASCGGCGREVLRIRGRVCTDSGLIESYLNVTRELRGTQEPVGNAKIYLSGDGGASSLGTDYETVSDADGFYELDVTDLPRRVNRQPPYVLVVKKVGFETLSESIAIGTFGHYMENTAVLKPAKEE